MPTVRISDLNWQRLQTWAVPLEDSVDEALDRVLDAAEIARERGLVVSGRPQKSAATLLPRTTEKHELERELKVALGQEPAAILEKQGQTMNTWHSNGKLRKRFWVTTNGSGLVYLPRRGQWVSDTQRKVIHHANPKSGWAHYDRFYLRKPEDVVYVLQILRDEIL